ncbi:uridine kinase [Monaibacterium marinum]|uniref:Uridine kinase n=1 Tax=Pontivivens marinum TaxID=1690039 RepID=A0A2C9CRQ9_9RHOB|nr:hypothetical protein [Monaibacterium marinum]SOH93845.1 uridine kinase [Monaibacterium marinum]
MILTVCGIPGSGKSTVAKLLARHLKAPLVAWDEYETMTQRSPDEIAAWLARGAPFSEIEAPGLVERLRGAGELTVFDSLLGPTWPPCFDLKLSSIWLECPADIALARKVSQLLAQVGPEWITGYLAAYPKTVAPALAFQKTRVPQLCDLTLDATMKPQSSVDSALRHFLYND